MCLSPYGPKAPRGYPVPVNGYGWVPLALPVLVCVLTWK